MNRFLRNEDGAVLIEFIIVLPLLLLLTFSIIDMGLLMWQWNHAAKATHFGARYAAVFNSVSPGVTEYGNPGIPALTGKSCNDPLTGVANPISSTNPLSLCPPRTVECTSAGCVNTLAAPGDPNTVAFSQAAFDELYNVMEKWFPQLEPENVRIIYSSVGLGFVDRPGGSPFAVTVSLQCASTTLIWLDLFFSAPDGCNNFRGAPIPAMATTLITEDLATNFPWNLP